MSIVHVKTVTVPDVTNTAIVRPIDWNSQHIVGAALVGNTLGVSSLSGTDIVFSGGPNVTLSGIQGAGVGTLVLSAAAGGAGGSINFSAGTTSGNLDSLVFSNSNNVSFGLNGSTITASATIATSLSNIRISAGTTSNLLSALTFSNLNGVSFGLDGSTITASIAAGGAPGSISAGTTRFALGEAVFSNSNGVSFGLDGATVTASIATSLTNIRVSGGTTSNLLSAITFGDANGVSFGLNASTMTASIATSLTNIRVSAGTTSNLLSALTFADGNGISFGLNASTLTASYTVPTVTNSSWTVSDNGTSGTVARLAFTNLNGVTLSLSTGAGGSHTIVGSHNALTSQSNQNVTAANGGFAFQTLSFSNANGVSFGTSAGSAITGSVAAQTVDTAGIYALGNTTGQSSSSTYDLRTLSVEGAGIVSVGWSNSSLRVSATQSNQAFSAAGGSSAFQTLSFSDNAQASWTNNAGQIALTDIRASLFATSNTTQSSSGTQNIDALTFAGAGIASVGITGGSVVISVPAGAPSPVNFSAGTTSNNLGSVVFADSNRVSFGLNGSTITAQHALNFSAGTTSNNISDGVTFANSNGISFGLNASTITASVATSLTNINVSAGTTSNNLSAVVFSNSNGVSFGLNGSTITASAAGGAADGGVFAGVSTGGNTAGSTGTVSTGNFVLVGSNGITLSQSTGAAGSAATVTILGVPQITLSGAVLAPFAGYGGFVPLSSIEMLLVQNSLYVWPVFLPVHLTCDHIRLPMGLTHSSSAAASVQKGITYRLGIFTRHSTNATVLTQHYSTSYTIAASHNSNVSWMISIITAIGNSTSYNTLTASSAGIGLSASVHAAQRYFILPVSSLLTPGEYWFAMGMSSSSVGAGGNLFNISHQAISIRTHNRLGLSTNSTLPNFNQVMGAGLYSATTAAMPVAISQTQIIGWLSHPVIYAATGTV